MKARKGNPNQEQRMLDIDSASIYINLGITATRKLLKSIGAERHIGRRVVFDKRIIDAYLDGMETETMIQ